MTQFADAFKPKQDLIYGIGAWITRYIVHFDSKGAKKYGGKERIPEDEWDAAHQRKEVDCFAINTFNMAITNAQYAMAGDTLSVANVGSGDYMSAFQKTKYGTASTVGSAKALTDKLKKGNEALSLSSPEAVCAAAKDLAIRRSSKFGIKYATDTLDGKVHYILDDIDQSVLLAKATITNGSGYTKIPICTSEIRYLFRTWNRYQSGKVVFWQNYAQTSPPWKTHEMPYRARWAAYAVERLWKYRHKTQTIATLAKFGTASEKDYRRLLVNVEKFIENNVKKQENATTVIKQWFGEDVTGPDDIIRTFHSIKFELVNDDAEPV